jgi:glycosyltransferase involved in cell wall biosynthesis
LSFASSLRAAAAVLRGEGILAVRDRALDRWHDIVRARRFAPLDAKAPRPFAVSVLNLLAMPLSPRLGGIPTQLQARLVHEERRRPTAVLSPAGANARLEVTRPDGGKVTRFALATEGGFGPGFCTRNGGFEDLVGATARRLGATIVHAEGLAGLPLDSLLRLRDLGLRLVVSVHDFSAFCVRPHLIEHPLNRFCDYSRDDGRCDACLVVDTPLRSGDLAAHRAAAERLLGEADAVVFASPFLMRQHQQLFPGAAAALGARGRVVEPASGAAAPPARRADTSREGRAHRPQHVAFVGAVQPHKGALVFEDVVRCLATDDRFRFTVLGGGDPRLAARLAGLPRVAVRGYYRAGSLPRLLREREVDVALLLSVWPEAYGMTFDECLAAGVPVVAFDRGAIADRMRATGQEAGLVPANSGASGVVSALRQLPFGARVTGQPRLAAAAAEETLATYEGLGYNPLLPTRPASQ